MKIDLNVDMGESFGRYVLGNDEELMKYVTSANIATCFHAGDPLVLDQPSAGQRSMVWQWAPMWVSPTSRDLEGAAWRFLRKSFGQT